MAILSVKLRRPQLGARRLRLAATLATAVFFVYLAQGPSSPATAHYALVKSLARGTAVIDETRFETGPEPTHDISLFHGHTYANKAPGLAFVALPAYLALDAAGVRTTGDPKLVLWVLTLVGSVLPTLVLLVLVSRFGDRLAPGYGLAAAVTLGLGTLLTTYATVFFPHALSAVLIFGAFVLLERGRHRDHRLALVSIAGLLAGYAFTTEYHNAFGAVVLGLYAIAQREWRSRAVAFSLGAVTGTVPLLCYNLWAFGSATHLSYEGAPLRAGELSGGTLSTVSGGLGAPSFHAFISLLLSRWGLLTTAPVLAAGVVGAGLMARRGARAEALVIGAVTSAYLLFSSAWYAPFGQIPPGPRFLVPALPFLAVSLAIAFREIPYLALPLAAVSVAVSVAVAVTHPHIAWDGHMVYRIAHPSWWSPTLADLVGASGAYRVLPLVAAVVVAVSCTLVATPLRRREEKLRDG